MRRTDDYRRITVQPLSGALGAEIEGVDITAMDDDSFAEVRRAFAENLVIFFRDQNLTLKSHEAFMARFGKMTLTYYVKPIDGSDYVARLLRHADAPVGGRNFGDHWHSDQAIRERPPGCFSLYSVDCPPYGGDTMFSNSYLAWDHLSDGLKAMCEQLTVVFSSRVAYGGDGQGGGRGAKPLALAGTENTFKISPEEMQAQMAREMEHPLVCIHPDTGRKYLFTTQNYSLRFKGWTEEESRPLLNFLHRHMERAEFTVRFRWSRGALALIDNRCCHHLAVNDYAGFRREMWRVEVEGNVPYGPARPLPQQQAAE
jgi:taurine dioxygenase